MRFSFLETGYSSGWFGGLYLNERYLGNFGGDGGREATYTYLTLPDDGPEATLTFSLGRGPSRSNAGPGRVVCLLRDIEVAPLGGDNQVLPEEFRPQPVTHTVRIAPNHRYFVLDDGRSFYPVGMTAALFGNRVDLRVNDLSNWNFDTVEGAIAKAEE
jgi:hypothetical protein